MEAGNLEKLPGNVANDSVIQLFISTMNHLRREREVTGQRGLNFLRSEIINDHGLLCVSAPPSPPPTDTEISLFKFKEEPSVGRNDRWRLFQRPPPPHPSVLLLPHSSHPPICIYSCSPSFSASPRPPAVIPNPHLISSISPSFLSLLSSPLHSKSFLSGLFFSSSLVP